MTTKTRLQAAADLLRQGRLTEARTRLLKELRRDPKSAQALGLLGAVAFEMGKHEEAIGYLRRAASLSTASPGPSLNLGKALIEAGRLDEAAEVLKAAVGRWPNIPEGRFSLGNVLHAQARPELAAEEYRAAVRLAPAQTGAYENLARTLYSLGSYEEVCSVCDRLLTLEPGSAVGSLYLAMASQRMCAWEGQEARLASAAQLVERGRIVRGMALSSMLFWDNAGLHRCCAELTAAFYAPPGKRPPSPRFSPKKSGRIRVAYVSADFREHPVASLVTALIEGHDRDRFEIVGVSLGRDDDSPERKRLEVAFHRFLDVSGSATDAIVRDLRAMEIDVAVDLMGYTTDCRPRIFIERVAPVQASFLGFPGTTAIAAMDYLIVDPFIAAGEIRHTAAERLAILPDCYLPSDGLNRALADPPGRASFGLPEDAPVFCSFNQARKITPEVFDRWMRILRQVDGSVLWLSRPKAPVEAALRSEAQRRGVDAGRIVFADRVASHDLHIARNGLPDLHLDTFPYNAHTTASDALRAGAPILTRAGTSFQARVCGSLLTTIGVPELITYGVEEYEALAVRLAHDKALLSSLRHRIEEGRACSPLFDVPRYCRNIERAYEAMVELSRAGKPPQEVDVRAVTSV